MASSISLSVLAYVVVQRPAFAELLGLARITLAGEEPWLLPAAIISTSLILQAPALIVAMLLQLRGWSRASRHCFIGLSSSATFLILLDLDLLRSVGRHLTEIAWVALEPQGHVAGGDLASWFWMMAQWATLALCASSGVTFACEHVVHFAASRLTPLLRRTLHWAAAVGLILFVSAPHVMTNGWRNPALFERLYGNLPLDLRLGDAEPDDQEHADPQLRALYPRLRAEYRAAFPGVSSSKAVDGARPSLMARPPNVVLIVTESLRHDVFGEELMPRLSRWAGRGALATRHDSGTIYSESGMFALLYGRSPAVFHQTLDAGVPPQLCVTLRNSGYECAYFTGHPKIWQRREEFLNERTMDRFVHDDRGTWPEWDQRALAGMVETLSTSEKPIFAIVLLMSSHFEYQYPPRYEIDRPVSDTAWHVTAVRTLGPEAETPHRNRYRNCVRFIDDVVADAIEKLDPERNLVILTGDHGESINDDGRYTHGYSFAEIVTRTPLVMVGPGVAPARLEQATSHVDVLPSVLHVLTGQRQQLAHTHGIDWFSGERRHSSLEAHSPVGGGRIDAQLRSGGYRLRLDFDLRRPQLRLLGFEDALGRLTPTPALSPEAADGLSAALQEQLSLLRR